jgi:VWFA-related protein
MRTWALCVILASIGLPAWGGDHAVPQGKITVSELERTVASGKFKTDAETARDLAGLTLQERLSTARLEQLETMLPGDKSRDALIAVADAAAFVDLPASEMPATALPDMAAQKRMMAMTVAYLGKTLPMLPNLFAARDTMRFESRPDALQGMTESPLREASRSRVTVLYRDGREFVDAGADKDKKAHAPDKGLTTWGEFGPILGTVLIDAAKSHLTWSHWEMGANGLEGVFHYAVPKDKSHYDVRFCCVADNYGFDISVVTERVGYHGEITVDPNSGTILRLTALADIGQGNPIGRADIAVEYGPVEIGGKTYFCPTRGIALARTPDLKTLHKALMPTGVSGTAATLQRASLSSIADSPREELLNDVAFREYHLFRGEARVMSGKAGEAGTHTAELPVPSPEAAAPVAQPGRNAVDASTLAAQPPSGTAVAMTTPGGEPPVGGDSEAVLPEIAVADATGLPSAPTLAQAGADSAVTLRLNARLVDVPLVALDKKGRPITNLKAEDLEIYDEGRKVSLSSFVPAVGGGATPVATTASASQTNEPGEAHAYSNRNSGPAKTASHDTQGSTIILLIDSNLSWDDLANVREQMRTFLNKLQGEERVALYVMRRGGFQILQDGTTDHALLVTTLSKWTPSAENISLGQEQEARNRQSMEYVHGVDDLLNVNGHTQTDPTGNFNAADPNLRTLGDNPGRDAFGVMVNLARHLGTAPGHKSLVWIASDNVLADWTNGSLNIDKGDRIVQSSVLRAQEAMNDAHVSVYPMDVSRLEGGTIDASIADRNVQLNPTNPAVIRGCGVVSQPAPGQTTPPELTNGGDITTCQSDLRNGRMTAQMQQDLHPVQGAYRELADATGGRVFRRASDIVTEFNSVAADGRATYLLSFTPPEAADGKYHLITMKLAGRKDVTLRYRTGYFYRAEPSTIKDRFQEAVLEPEDATQIALSADPVAGSGGRTVKLDIAATDLAIAQKDALWMDKLDVYLVQREVSGTKAHITGQTLGLRLKPATYQQYLHDGIPFSQAIEAGPGIGSVRIVVLDENSGRMGSVTIPASAIGKAE